ncbi:MAG: DUF11 domain-containing protein [Blastocatellia bacterium]|nr:DUF11 domain-containing protein [Blastocatellia bacterium]
MPTTKTSEILVLVNQSSGVTIIPQPTPLTRLNYFDGKFLRASDLKAEQSYLRQLVQQSNQAGGVGIANGFDVTLGTGDALEIGAGLAIDPAGRVLLLPQTHTVNLQELIEKSRSASSAGLSKRKTSAQFGDCEVLTAAPPVTVGAASELYVIVVAHAEALCGEEDVFGKLCEEACATSTDRPFVVEGLTVRAIPLVLQTALPNFKAVALTNQHLRSRVASAYFADERRRVASLISKAGLESGTWCLGADADDRTSVPIAVVARAGTKTVFLDPWIARRERMDAPAKRYWQWRMMMRPWDVYLAQILQFQCQLHDLFRQQTPGEEDPCNGARSALKEAAEVMAEVSRFYEAASKRLTTLRLTEADESLVLKGGLSNLTTVNARLLAVSSALGVIAPQDRLLIRGGLVELPSAGYLPVVPGANLTINQQVRRMMGEGVDLRFCVVRPDYVAHALEEAQHLERISLLQGLDDPKNKPEVDILVPNGEILAQQRLSPGRGFEASVDVNSLLLAAPNTGTTNRLTARAINFRGAARAESLASGGGAAYISGLYEISRANSISTMTNRVEVPPANVVFGTAATLNTANLTAVRERPRGALWISLRCERDAFALKRGDTTNFNARAVIATSSNNAVILDVELKGELQITQATVATGTTKRLKGRIENAQLSFLGAGLDNPTQRKTILVDLNASLTMTGDAAIEIFLDHADNDFTLSANWGQDPLEVKAAITTKTKNADGQATDITVADADFKENSDVLSAKNTSHVQALDALEVIAAALNDVTFADAKARLLFPPPPPLTDETTVRGTTDWVLFHRRRTKQCSEVVVEPPPPVPARSYQVYQILAQNIDDAEALKKFLSAGQIPANRLSAVAVVEYGGGVATLLTPAADIQKDWQIAKPGNTIYYGAIANRDSAAADGEPLSRSRLDRLEDALAPISKLHPQATDDFLSNVPASIPAAGVDGVIVLITLNVVTANADLTITKSATPATVTAGQTITYTLQLNNTGPTEAQNVTVTDAIPANTTFVAATVSAGSGWSVTNPAAGGVGNVVFSKNSVAAGETASFQIVARVNTNVGNGATISNTATIASGTADPNAANNTATINTIVAAQRTALVVFSTPIAGTVSVHVPAQGSTQTKVTFINNIPQGTALADSFKGLPPGTSLGRVTGVTLADVVAPLEADAQARLNLIVNALKSSPGGPQNPKVNPPVMLSQPDKDQLTSHAISIAGIDEIIYLELFG